MFVLYTVAPIIYRLASSPFYNLSLLSSDFFGLLFGECRTPRAPWPNDFTSHLARLVPLRERRALAAPIYASLLTRDVHTALQTLLALFPILRGCPHWQVIILRPFDSYSLNLLVPKVSSSTSGRLNPKSREFLIHSDPRTFAGAEAMKRWIKTWSVPIRRCPLLRNKATYDFMSGLSVI